MHEGLLESIDSQAIAFPRDVISQSLIATSTGGITMLDRVIVNIADVDVSGMQNYDASLHVFVGF